MGVRVMVGGWRVGRGEDWQMEWVWGKTVGRRWVLGGPYRV